MKDYIKLYETKKRNDLKKEKEQKEKQQQEYKQEAVSNYDQLVKENEEYKKKFIHNEQSRVKALSFSKGLLKVLNQYHTKEKKLARLDEIDEYIRTKLTPERFKDQVLIKYVLDYMDIVRYSLELQ